MSTLLKFELAPYTLQFEAGADYPAARRVKIFQVQERTAAGNIKTENLGITTYQRDLNFNLMSDTDYSALINWYVNISIGSKNSFIFTDEYGNVYNNAKLLDNELDFSEQSLSRHSGKITLEY